VDNTGVVVGRVPGEVVFLLEYENGPVGLQRLQGKGRGQPYYAATDHY